MAKLSWGRDKWGLFYILPPQAVLSVSSQSVGDCYSKSREKQSGSGLHLSKPGRRINRQSQRDARKMEESLIQFELEVLSL